MSLRGEVAARTLVPAILSMRDERRARYETRALVLMAAPDVFDAFLAGYPGTWTRIGGDGYFEDTRVCRVDDLPRGFWSIQADGKRDPAAVARAQLRGREDYLEECAANLAQAEARHARALADVVEARARVAVK